MTPFPNVAPSFRDEIDRIRALYFSRDPACWPIFSDPVFSEIAEFRKKKTPPRERVQQFPNGGTLLRQLREQDRLPTGGRDPRSGVDPTLVFAAALSKNWEDPASVENVITSPSDPALFGSMAGVLANANLVHPEYFEKNVEGQTHLHATIECSRSAAGLFGAYTALHYLGIEGFQRLVANTLQNANYFRSRLSSLPGVKLMAAENQGPSVGFRMYDPEVVSDPDAEFQYECRVQDSAEYRARVERNSRHHRDIFLRRGKIGLYTNWVEFIAHTDYDARGRCGAIPGEKAVFLNPRTRYEDIDQFIAAMRG